MERFTLEVILIMDNLFVKFLVFFSTLMNFVHAAASTYERNNFLGPWILRFTVRPEPWNLLLSESERANLCSDSDLAVTSHNFSGFPFKKSGVRNVILKGKCQRSGNCEERFSQITSSEFDDMLSIPGRSLRRGDLTIQKVNEEYSDK
jgi:hypothetical protein